MTPQHVMENLLVKAALPKRERERESGLKQLLFPRAVVYSVPWETNKVVRDTRSWFPSRFNLTDVVSMHGVHTDASGFAVIFCPDRLTRCLDRNGVRRV